MEVLFEFSGSRRHITVASSEAITEIVARELQRLGKRRAQVYTADADLSEVRGRAYLLQVWCPQWESYVDVRDSREVEDGDRLAVTPKPKPPSVLKRLCCCCYSGEDTQPDTVKSRKRQQGKGKQNKYWPEEIRELEYHFAVHSEPGSEWDLSSLSSALRQETVENGIVQIGDGVGLIELEDQSATPVAMFVRDSTGCASWRLVPSAGRKGEVGQGEGEGREGGAGERRETEEGVGEERGGETEEERGEEGGGETEEGRGEKREGETEEGVGEEGGGEMREEGGGETGEEGGAETEEGGGEERGGEGEREEGIDRGGEGEREMGGGGGEERRESREEEEEEEGYRGSRELS